MKNHFKAALVVLLSISSYASISGQNSSMGRKSHNEGINLTAAESQKIASRNKVVIKAAPPDSIGDKKKEKCCCKGPNKDSGMLGYFCTMKYFRLDRAHTQHLIDSTFNVNVDDRTIGVTRAHEIKDSLVDVEDELTSKRVAISQAKFFNKGFYFFPATNTFSTNAYFTREGDKNRWQTLSNTYLTSNFSDRASAFSEVLSVNYGVFRIGLHTMIAGTKQEKISQNEIDELLKFGSDPVTQAEIDERKTMLDDKRKEYEAQNKINLAAQNIITGGSNIALNASMPLFWFNNSRRSFLGHGEMFLRGGGVVPEIGTLSNDFAFTSAVGFTGNFWLNLQPQRHENQTSFAISLFPTIMWIKNSYYKEQFENKDGAFCYGEIVLNLEISQLWRITFKQPFIDKDVSQPTKNAFKFQAGINVIIQ